MRYEWASSVNCNDKLSFCLELSYDELLQNNHMTVLIEAANSVKFPLLLYIADILTELSTSGKSFLGNEFTSFVQIFTAEKMRLPLIEKNGLDAAFRFLSSFDADLQLSGITIVFNSLYYAQHPAFERVYGEDFVALTAEVMLSTDMLQLRLTCSRVRFLSSFCNSH